MALFRYLTHFYVHCLKNLTIFLANNCSKFYKDTFFFLISPDLLKYVHKQKYPVGCAE